MARRKYDDDFVETMSEKPGDDLCDGLWYDDGGHQQSENPSSPKAREEEEGRAVKIPTTTPTESQEDKDVEYYNRMYTVLKKVEQQQERVESILHRNEESLQQINSLTTQQEKIAAAMSIDSDALLNPVRTKFKEFIQEETNAFVQGIHGKVETESNLVVSSIHQSVKTDADLIKQVITNETTESVQKIKSTKDEKEGKDRISIPTTVLYRYIVYMMGAISFGIWAGRDKLIEIWGSDGDAKIFMICGCCGLIYQIGRDIWLFVKKIWGDYHNDKRGGW